MEAVADTEVEVIATAVAATTAASRTAAMVAVRRVTVKVPVAEAVAGSRPWAAVPNFESCPRVRSVELHI